MPGTATSVIYGELDCQGTQLDPMVVDLLGDKDKLELFVKARAVNLIDLAKVSGNQDFYLFPEDRARYRLSKMSTPDEIDAIVADVAYNASRQGLLQDAGKSGDQLKRRLRLLYALRTFVLRRSDLEDSNRAIDYKELKAQVKQCLANYTKDELKQHYLIMMTNYQQLYKDYYKTQDNLTVLAHLGLVLAKVAYDLYAILDETDINIEGI